MSSNGRGRQPSEAAGVLPWVTGIVALALGVGGVWWWSHGKTFPEVSSPESLHLMRALYTACSSQNETRLQVVERKLAAAREAGKLSAEEQAAFDRIMSYARAADWDQAAKQSYRFARDQVR